MELMLQIKSSRTNFPTLNLTNQKKELGGFTGCNRLSGSYETVENKLTFSPLAVTKMFCQGVNENEFLEALTGVNKFKIENLKLYLYKDDEAKLIFKKVD